MDINSTLQTYFDAGVQPRWGCRATFPACRPPHAAAAGWRLSAMLHTLLGQQPTNPLHPLHPSQPHQSRPRTVWAGLDPQGRQLHCAHARPAGRPRRPDRHLRGCVRGACASRPVCLHRGATERAQEQRTSQPTAGVMGPKACPQTPCCLFLRARAQATTASSSGPSSPA